MPLITRRSSTRALPRVSVGRCGLIFENCAFVSQNWSRLIYASFSEAVNHAITFVPTLLWVRTLGQRPKGAYGSRRGTRTSPGGEAMRVRKGALGAGTGILKAQPLGIP